MIAHLMITLEERLGSITRLKFIEYLGYSIVSNNICIKQTTYRMKDRYNIHDYEFTYLAWNVVLVFGPPCP